MRKFFLAIKDRAVTILLAIFMIVQLVFVMSGKIAAVIPEAQVEDMVALQGYDPSVPRRNLDSDFPDEGMDESKAGAPTLGGIPVAFGENAPGKLPARAGMPKSKDPVPGAMPGVPGKEGLAIHDIGHKESFPGAMPGVPGEEGKGGVPGEDGKGGKPGADNLNPAPGKDNLNPTPGTANLHPTPGTANLNPTPKTDKFNPIPGSDNVNPTPGTANLNPTPGTANLNPTPGTANLNPTPGKLNASPVPGKDNLNPTPGTANLNPTPGHGGVPDKEGRGGKPGADNKKPVPGAMPGTPGTDGAKAGQDKKENDPYRDGLLIIYALEKKGGKYALTPMQARHVLRYIQEVETLKGSVPDAQNLIIQILTPDQINYARSRLSAAAAQGKRTAPELLDDYAETALEKLKKGE
ncbi:MAG: hypothetical protein K6G50_01290 [bacterium]|nr:hypothetical protein [bacterium]